MDRPADTIAVTERPPGLLGFPHIDETAWAAASASARCFRFSSQWRADLPHATSVRGEYKKFRLFLPARIRPLSLPKIAIDQGSAGSLPTRK
jgi:hypothetical protein